MLNILTSYLPCFNEINIANFSQRMGFIHKNMIGMCHMKAHSIPVITLYFITFSFPGPVRGL